MSIIHEKETQNILDMPVTELAKLCVDPTILIAALSLAYQQGYKSASERCHRFYRMMFAGQNGTAIKN